MTIPPYLHFRCNKSSILRTQSQPILRDVTTNGQNLAAQESLEAWPLLMNSIHFGESLLLTL